MNEVGAGGEAGTKARQPKIYFFNSMVLNQGKFSILAHLNLSLPYPSSRGCLVMPGDIFGVGDGGLLLASSESRTLLNILPKKRIKGHPITNKELSFPKDSVPVLRNSALTEKLYSYEKV